MSTYDTLISDLTRDVHRVHPKDVLQFCASWFQSRLEEQRAITRDVLSQRLNGMPRDLPREIYQDIPLGVGPGPEPVSPFSLAPDHRDSRSSIPRHNAPRKDSPFGTLNVPGNALLAHPQFRVDGRELPPTSPLNTAGAPAFTSPFQGTTDGGDFLQPPSSNIFARRTSVSAESIALDTDTGDLPFHPKTPEQLARIQASIRDNFIFRDLSDEQEIGVLNAMQELQVDADNVIIKQGEEGEYFYVVEAGLFDCYIRPEPLPKNWLAEDRSSTSPEAGTECSPETKTKIHPKFGKRVAECKPGNAFGELALMYGHARAATVLSLQPSTVWQLDRITFRTIILKAAHRRRQMYEGFLSNVTLLQSLDDSQKSKIADALKSNVYEDGMPVVRQGEMGDAFFFVEEGQAIVTKTHRVDDQEKTVQVGNLSKGDYFGELSLLRLAPRAATVSAARRTDTSQPKLKVAVLDAAAFTRLLGPLREIMEAKASNYGSGMMRRSIPR